MYNIRNRVTSVGMKCYFSRVSLVHNGTFALCGIAENVSKDFSTLPETIGTANALAAMQ